MGISSLKWSAIYVVSNVYVKWRREGEGGQRTSVASGLNAIVDILAGLALGAAHDEACEIGVEVFLHLRGEGGLLGIGDGAFDGGRVAALDGAVGDFDGGNG